MDFPFLKFFVLFYAYNKYSERHCGIYLRFTCIFGELVAVGDRNPDIEAALEFYENDLPSPQVVDVELLRWKRKWFSTEDADLPTSAVQTLAACDREFFPNIHTLIRILCTLPITSAECEILELNPKGPYLSLQEEKDNFCVVFTYSIKRACEVRNSHVVVVQRRQRNVQNSVMQVLIFCSVNKNLLLFSRSPSVPVVIGFVVIQK